MIDVVQSTRCKGVISAIAGADGGTHSMIVIPKRGQHRARAGSSFPCSILVVEEVND